MDLTSRHRPHWCALSLAVSFCLLPSLPVAAGAEELIIFEAASLKEVFGRLSIRFEKEQAGVKVVTNAAGSQQLRAQLEHGATADLFASADGKQMDALVAQGLVTEPWVFTCNEPVVIVRTALASSITSLVDLARAERIVIAAPDVPIGNYTLQILRKAAATAGADFPARVQARVASRELNVRQVLAKVVLGEADAGVVYRSDALAARGRVAIVTIPSAFNVVAAYPIAVLKAAPHRELAQRWSALIKSPAGAAALREAGFVPCPAS